jgi:hypothetical protein
MFEIERDRGHKLLRLILKRRKVEWVLNRSWLLAAGKARTEAIPPMTKARLIDDVKPIAGGGGREWTVSCFHPGLDSSFITTARQRESHRDVQQSADDEKASQMR